MNEIRNILIGFQFGMETSQICYYDRKGQEPLSVPTKTGSSLYEFPTALCKMEGKEDWHFGLEADYFGSQFGGIKLHGLYELCKEKESLMVDKRLMEPWELLEIFFWESLKLLGVKDPVKSISSIMVTCENLSKTLVENIQKAFEHRGFSKQTCHIQDFDESFYYYTMYQKPEIWMRKTALYHFHDKMVSYQELTIDQKTRPAMVSLSAPKDKYLSELPGEWDMDFYHTIQDTMGTDTFSSVYLIGEEFKKEWAVKSLPLLSRNKKHIFYGNNLYVKGACYGAKEYAEEKKLKDYLYLGKDLVRANVGMEMITQGMKVYYPLVAAGVNWFEAGRECEFILDGTGELVFLVSSMEGGERKAYSMDLPGLPKRPNRTTRLHLDIQCESPKCCAIRVCDMGFGEMYPSTQTVWTETIEL